MSLFLVSLPLSLCILFSFSLFSFLLLLLAAVLSDKSFENAYDILSVGVLFICIEPAFALFDEPYFFMFDKYSSKLFFIDILFIDSCFLMEVSTSDCAG